MIRTDRLNVTPWRSRCHKANARAGTQHSLYKVVSRRKALACFLECLVAFGLLTGSFIATADTDTNTDTNSGANIRPVQIAAAASLRAVWQDLEKSFPTNIAAADFNVSFASTGLLQVQIANGAPFDLFLAADRASPQKLEQLGLTRSSSSPYASGRLVLIAKKSAAETLEDAVTDLGKQHQSSSAARLAIANPRHAPYGKASRQWLEHHKLWPWPSDALLLSENTAQALQFVNSGAVDYALLPTALGALIDSTLNVFEIPDTHYDLVDHQLIIMRDAPSLTDAIADWLQQSTAQTVFESYGLDRFEP